MVETDEATGKKEWTPTPTTVISMMVVMAGFEKSTKAF
jgi:hypothetical protein